MHYFTDGERILPIQQKSFHGLGNAKMLLKKIMNNIFKSMNEFIPGISNNSVNGNTLYNKNAKLIRNTN